MHMKAIRDQLAIRPFEPFEFVMSSGDRFPVTHPENAIMMKERVLLAYYESPQSKLPDRSTSLSYLHIAAFEPIARKRKAAARR